MNLKMKKDVCYLSEQKMQRKQKIAKGKELLEKIENVCK